MKRILFGTFAFGLLCACSGGEYSVTTILPEKDLDGTMAYLTNYDTGDTIDSAYVKGNSLLFKGEVKEPYMARIMTSKGSRINCIIEKGAIEVNVKERIVKGTKLNEEYNNFSDRVRKLNSEMDDNQDASEKGKMSKEDAIAKNKEIYKQLSQVYKTVYNENKNNPIGYYTFFEYTYEMNGQQLDSVLKDAPSKYMNGKRLQKWAESVKKKDLTAVGKKFVDFSVKSEDGVVTHFSSFVGRGKYTLVDFWASWCGPCIRETDVVREIYNKYADKGLDVLGVAVWDEPQNTRAAIAKHSITWPQIIDAKSIPTDIYGILGIPHIIIFSPDGTILARGLQGDELKAKVDEVMAKANIK